MTKILSNHAHIKQFDVEDQKNAAPLQKPSSFEQVTCTTSAVILPQKLPDRAKPIDTLANTKSLAKSLEKLDIDLHQLSDCQDGSTAKTKEDVNRLQKEKTDEDGKSMHIRSVTSLEQDFDSQQFQTNADKFNTRLRSANKNKSENIEKSQTSGH